MARRSRKPQQPILTRIWAAGRTLALHAALLYVWLYTYRKLRTHASEAEAIQPQASSTLCLHGCFSKVHQYSTAACPGPLSTSIEHCSSGGAQEMPKVILRRMQRTCDPIGWLQGSADCDVCHGGSAVTLNASYQRCQACNSGSRHGTLHCHLQRAPTVCLLLFVCCHHCVH